MSELVGSIHGRFQPFHKGHLEYALRALERCNHLIIGITQHNIDALRWTALDVAKHRSDPGSNPFSYGERVEIIEAALFGEGVDKDRITIVPFPIETPRELSQYVKKDVRIFTTIYDEWNRSKIALLENEGYQVEVLWERDVKKYEGKHVRHLIYEGDLRWKDLVPAGAIDLIERYW